MWRPSLVILCALLGITYGKTGSSKYLSVRYDLLSGYYDMPKTLKELENFPKYQKVGHDEELNVDLYSYEGDPRVFVLFDNYGNIAGLRMGLIKEDLSIKAKENNVEFVYNLDTLPIYSSGRFWDKDIWYTDVLFISPEALKAGGREVTNGVVAQDIYLKLDGKWTYIPKDQCQVEALGFKEQGCLFGMGKHYYYNLTPETDCTKLDGTFLLFEFGKLVGLGFTPFGTFTNKDRKWLENPPELPIKIIAPNRPPCLLEWLNNYGVASFHIFFERFPRVTNCIWPWQKKNQCKKTDDDSSSSSGSS